MSWSVKIWLRDKTLNSAGLAPLYMRVIVDRVKKDISLKKWAQPAAWAGDKLRGKTMNTERLNIFLGQKKAAMEKILWDQELTGRLDIVKAVSLFKQEKSDNLFSDLSRELAGKLSANSFRSRESTARKIEAFRPRTRLADIDYLFLIEFEKWAALNGNVLSTVNKDINWIRVVLNEARRRGYVKEWPFDKFKVKHILNTRPYMELDELKVLEDLYIQNEIYPPYHKVLKYFLFSCYTGLRFTDIKALEREHIRDNCVIIPAQKTGVNTLIPLTEKALKLIDPDKPGYCFQVISNQKTNEYLKHCLKLAGITKRVTFHTARHTFAMICLNDLDMSMEVVSKLLAHINIKTTSQVYAKLEKRKLQNEMQKWDKL